MGFKSILYEDYKVEAKLVEPAFFRDLQLHYIVDMIGKMTRNYEIRKYFYNFIDSKELIQYRHEILLDLN